VKVQDLESFLATADKKGFITPPVYKQTRAAVEKVKVMLESDPDSVALDLRAEGVVEDLFRRYMTKNPNAISPESAGVYINRVRKAVENGGRYLDDPLSYKTTFASGMAGKAAPKTSQSKAKTKSEDKSKNSVSSVAEDLNSVSADRFLASFPLRRDFMLNMHLPKDLNTQEVKRFAFYLLSLCEDFNPVKANVFYQDGAPPYSAIESARND